MAASYYFMMLIGIAGKNLIGPETYGPQVRGSGMGFIMAIARIAAVAAPIFSGFLMDISDNNPLYPLSTFAIALILSGVSAAFLKDTKPALREEK